MDHKNICESCGMPMRSDEDFGGGLTDNKYCIHCTDTEGNLKSFDEISKGMKNFMMRNMGVSEEEAIEGVKEAMAKMPAWSDKF